jgi:hypothetical protein
MRTPRAVSVGALLQPALDAPDLDAEVIAGRIGLDRSITSPHLQKTGLALAGFDEYLRPGRILVLGESEIRFLASRAASERRELAARLLGHQIPAILSTAGLTPIVELVEACNLAGVPLLLMSTPTGTAMAQMAARLDHHLARASRPRRARGPAGSRRAHHRRERHRQERVRARAREPRPSSQSRTTSSSCGAARSRSSTDRGPRRRASSWRCAGWG